MDDDFLAECKSWVKSNKEDYKTKYDKLKQDHQTLQEKYTKLSETLKEYKKVMTEMMAVKEEEDIKDNSKSQTSTASSKKRKTVSVTKISKRETLHPKTPYRLCEPSEEEDPTGIGRRVWEAIIKAQKDTDGSMVTASEVLAQGGVHMMDGSPILTMDHINKYIHQPYHTNIPHYQRKITYKQSPTDHWLFVVPEWLNQQFY